MANIKTASASPKTPSPVPGAAPAAGVAPVATSLVERLADPIKCGGCTKTTRVYATTRLPGGRVRRYCKCQWCGFLQKIDSPAAILTAAPAPIQTR